MGRARAAVVLAALLVALVAGPALAEDAGALALDAASLAEPAPVDGGGAPEPSSFGALLLRTVFVLGGVLVVTWVVLVKGLPALMRLNPEARRAMVAQGSRGVVEVVDRLSLDPRRTLYVVKVGGGHYLLGVTEQGMSLLSRVELEPPPPEAAAASPPTLGKFPSFLQKLRERDA